VAIANESAGRTWGKLIGAARCKLALNLAAVAATKDQRKTAEYIKRAKALAVELRRFNRVAAARYEGSAMDLERYVKEYTPEYGAEIVKVLEKGLQGAGSADLTDQFEINRTLAGFYSGGNLPDGKDWDKAFHAMKAASRAAGEAGLDADILAKAFADAAFCRLNGLATAKDDATRNRYRQGVLENFRMAFETAPSHPDVWFWKLKAASEGCTPLGIALLAAEPQETPARVVKEARLLEEAARFYRDVKVTMPLAQVKNFPWIDGERKIVNQKAKPVLEKVTALAPNHSDVWMWQWALAEIFADSAAADSNPEALAAAKQRIAAAEKAMPAEPPHLPGETRQRYRDRKDVLQQFRDQISQLRKDLERQK
jgi:hypothetical protein